MSPTFALLGLAASASAQQFTFVDVLPLPKNWTEGVAAADVDNDGDKDLFFAEGNGFSSAGAQRQNRLEINEFEVAPGQFSDESVARLGVNVSNGKGVFTGDLDNDGWVDAVFCNAFNTDRTFVYVNRGSAQPGFFDEDGLARGFPEAYSCASGQFGDLDNDGDLDVILCDSGNSFLGGAGERPHLFFNDGTGNFTENAAALNAPIKRAHMDVQLVDIDQDWDIDFFGPNRGSNTGGNHYLMLNDGAGNFTDASGLLPSTSTNVYEAEVAHLDDDGDVDMFFVSLTGFGEGPIFNDFVENGGTLGFTKGAQVGGADDNEVAMFDYDMDGDLDAVIGSLGNTEKVIRNNGDGTFTSDGSVFQTVGDSTLDCSVVDLNNDGAYDVATAQGESNSNQYNNKIYINNGPVDSIAPSILRSETIADGTPGPWVVRAEVLDQVMDDGEDWITASVAYSIDGGASSQGDVIRAGVGMYRFEMADTAGGAGSMLTYELSFTDDVGNTTTSGPITVNLGGVACGYSTYGIGASPVNTLSLVGGSDGSIGGIGEVITTNSPAAGTFVAIAALKSNFPIVGGIGLVDLSVLLEIGFAPESGGTSTFSAPIPNDLTLIGVEVDFQSFAVDAGQPGGFVLSNGVELLICP